MNTRIAKWLAWSLVVFAVALSLGTLPLVVAITHAAFAPGASWPPQAVAQMQLSASGWRDVLGKFLITWVFTALGALIVSRSPARTLGWLFCALGVALVVDSFAGYYAVYALVVVPGTLPGGLVAGWIQHWTWLVVIALLLMFVPLRFPTGRLVTARWRPVWWLAVGVTVGGVLLLAFQPSPLFNYLGWLNLPNPLGVAGLAVVTPVLNPLLIILLLPTILLAAASLVVRLRRARGIERQQIKWFAYFAILMALLLAVSGVMHDALGISSPALDGAFSLSNSILGFGLVVSTGLSILRYRLFDIDILIRRTLVYGTLTALLAGIYFGVVISAQTVIQALTGQTKPQPLLIVASTLLTVALVTPLRRGLQTLIDRRFYRRKYDAQRTLAAFGTALRSEVDLAQLSERLVAVVEETMHPEHVSLWLKPLDHRVAYLDQPNRWSKAS